MDVKYSGRIKGCFLTSRETRKPKEGDVGTAQHFSSSFYTQFGTLTLFYMSLTFRVLLSLQFIFFEKSLYRYIQSCTFFLPWGFFTPVEPTIKINHHMKPLYNFQANLTSSMPLTKVFQKTEKWATQVKSGLM